MPKKRTYNFKPLQGSSSSSSKPSSTGNGGETTSSVNDRLSELRKLEGKDAAAKKRALAEAANTRSVPPDVRGLLGLSETAPPKPKANVRTRDRMRTPGPAPPKSWLAGSSSMWKSRTKADKHGRSKPRVLLRFSRLTGLDLHKVDAQPPSLAHLALKRIAESFDLLNEEDYPSLAEIPLRLRAKLLSYIDYYGSTIDVAALHALLQGNESTQYLDLPGLIGHGNLTLKKLGSVLERAQTDVAESEDVAESWDADDTLEGIPAFLQTNRFSSLTHLCISHPAPTVAWRDLLAFTKLVPRVTHLSLAYWPRPTLTPNLSTATVSSQHSPEVRAGGSHYYSALDQDMAEPAALLRQLSSNLLCLQWLDLEGCEDWTPAFSKLAADASITSSQEHIGRDGWVVEDTVPSILVSNWKNLRYLRCAQGWLPRVEGVQALSEQRDGTVIDKVIVDGISGYLNSTTLNFGGNISQDDLDVEKKRARLWLEHEYKVTYACMRINSVRRTHGLKCVEVDFGWIQRHAGMS